MTIKQQGGVFGRNPSFNDVETNTVEASTSMSSPLIDTLRITDDGASSLRVYSTQPSGRGLIFASGIIYPSGNSGASNNNGTDLGSAGVRFKDIYTNNVKLADGGGIDFSATSGTGTSELFDDYEEGTFDNSGGTLLTSNYTFVNRTGQYTKVGDTVTAWFRYEWTSTNLGSGDTILNAMPFTASNNGYVLITECNANIAADQIYGTVLSGTNQIKLYGRSNASTTLFGPAQKSVWQTGGVSNILAGVAVFKA